MESDSEDSIPSSFSFLSQRADSRPNSLMRASRVAFKKNSLRSAFCLGDFCTVILCMTIQELQSFKKYCCFMQYEQNVTQAPFVFLPLL